MAPLRQMTPMLPERRKDIVKRNATSLQHGAGHAFVRAAMRSRWCFTNSDKASFVICLRRG
jgi:hypothetical protein